jgi:hypothetical protein
MFRSVLFIPTPLGLATNACILKERMKEGRRERGKEEVFCTTTRKEKTE